MTNVSDFISHEYREYGRYVVFSRAIPSAVDGMKPSQRKILWTAMRHARSFTKTAALCGQVIVETDYHHGDSSLHDAASLMAADWANNLPVLVGEGNFGSRIVPVAAAARYTSVKVNPEVSKILLDLEECPRSVDGIEPDYFLPIIPILAVNGVEGIAVGYSTTILPRSVKSVLEAVRECANNPQFDPGHVLPSFPKFNGDVSFDSTSGRSTWFIKGKLHRPKRNSVVITELPYGYSRESYVEKLEKLVDSNKISTFVDETSNGVFKFLIKISNDLDRKSDGELLNELKLVVKVTENIVAIDPFGKIKTYQSIGELIREFVDFRMSVYPARFARLLKDTNEKLDAAQIKSWIIQEVIQYPSEFFGTTTKKSSIEAKFYEIADRKGYDRHVSSKYVPSIASAPIYHFTAESYTETMELIHELTKERARILGLSPTQEYLKDLESVR